MAKNENARAKTISALYEQLRYIYAAMLQAGFPAGIVTTYAMAQIMHESDWMTSNLGNVDNNYAGIKFVNQPGATPGIKSPEGGNYAHYDSFGAFLADYKRVLSLNTGGKGKPIDATTAQQFVERLAANHYFTDPQYYLKFNAALRRVSEALQWGHNQGQKFLQQYNNGQNTFTYTPGQGLTSNEAFDLDRWWQGRVNWAKANPGSAAAAVLGIILGVGLLKKAIS